MSTKKKRSTEPIGKTQRGAAGPRLRRSQDGMPPGLSRKPPARLSVERIVETALDLADRQGSQALSMRKLASALGVEAMSLYHHVNSRESLLDLMVDRVFAELTENGDAPVRPADRKKNRPFREWKGWMKETSAQMRSVLLNHPWSVGLLDSRRNPGPATLSYQNARLGRLRDAGFSLDMAAHAVAVQDSFIYGFVLQELALPFENEEDLEELVEDIQTSMPAGQYPHLEEMMQELVSRKDYSFYREFEFGLSLLIEGLEAKLGREKG